MKVRTITFTFLVLLISACSSKQSLPDPIKLELVTPQPSLSERRNNEQSVALLLHGQKCESVDKVYPDLSSAPKDILEGLPQTVSEVWILGGCAEGKKIRAEFHVLPAGIIGMTYSEYQDHNK